MPFMPHTPEQVAGRLADIGVPSLGALLGPVPPAPGGAGSRGVSGALDEGALTRLMEERAAQDAGGCCFIGAGAYDRHVPAAVWEVAARGDFSTVCPPTLPEAAQGTLQVLYEYQCMMAGLTGLAVSNGSVPDGASALAEAVLMAVRLGGAGGPRRVLMPASVHPGYPRAVQTLLVGQGVDLITVPWDPPSGRLTAACLDDACREPAAALVVAQPDFFGCLEEVHALTDRAHDRGMRVIALVNALSLAILEPPGRWGRDGADIACGDGQPLGLPLSAGGPGFGFLTCREVHRHQLPGLSVEQGADAAGNPAFVLDGATGSNCPPAVRAVGTGHGSAVTAATVHMSLLGPSGLAEVARACHANTAALLGRLGDVDGVERVFDGPFFHEGLLRIEAPPAEVLRSLAAYNVLGGFELAADYPEFENCLLVCATERRSAADVERYAERLERNHETPPGGSLPGAAQVRLSPEGVPGAGGTRSRSQQTT